LKLQSTTDRAMIRVMQPDSDISPPILYQDRHILAVDKPAGLLSVPGRGPDKQDCALSRVHASFPAALVVHRLDMATSGLLLFALDPQTQRALGALFEQRRVHKRYVACVRGVPEATQGTIDLPLARDWPRRPRSRVDFVNGRAAHTHYHRIAQADDGEVARLELMPTTGRSHQLRVHLAALGHPIVGDRLYADPETLGLATRLLLHADRLNFDHPVGSGALELASPAPF
jgi:tRNA pseudouridine32 synthase / 23S rRNA pseudouridine746 synthase